MTLIGQKWVAGSTLYAPERWETREALHNAILHNQLPDSTGTWDSIGANGLNVRVLTVWAAEGLHRLAGVRVERAYLWIETVSLLICGLLLYAFLASYAGWQFALGGLLYWGMVLPLTYLRHNFHPWDKPSIALWLLALICTWYRRWWILAAVLVIGVLTKYDIVIFPALVFLAYRRTDPTKDVVLKTTLLLAVTLSTYLALRALIPGGFEPRSSMTQVMDNLSVWREMTITYPPLLALALPSVLAALGYRTADDFARGCVQLAVIVTAILFLQTNFVEFRAEVPLLLLLFPAARQGLLRLTGVEFSPART